MSIDIIVYLDNASTTRISDAALEAYTDVSKNNYGNASSLYFIGRKAKDVLEKSRKMIADCIGAEVEEIFFTSGGSESNNWVLRNYLFLHGFKNYAFLDGHKIITSKFEHPSILNTLNNLGINYYLCPTMQDGRINEWTLANRLDKDDFSLGSIMIINNEVGTFNDIKTISDVFHSYNIPFHTDAVQALGHFPIEDVRGLGIDFLSGSAHKFNGPKGIGFLYVSKDKQKSFSPLVHGGHQEKNFRAGTENVAGAYSMAVALKDSCDNMDNRALHIQEVKNKLIDGLLDIPTIELNGNPQLSYGIGICNFYIPWMESESLVLTLNTKGICASAGSACSSGSATPSPTIMAMFNDEYRASHSIRFSIGHQNTMEEVKYVIDVMWELYEIFGKDK